jgi:hypothetical protein
MEAKSVWISNKFSPNPCGKWACFLGSVGSRSGGSGHHGCSSLRTAAVKDNGSTDDGILKTKPMSVYFLVHLSYVEQNFKKGVFGGQKPRSNRK